MWPNPQFPADLVAFTEEMLNGKLHFLYNIWYIFSAVEGNFFIQSLSFLNFFSNRYFYGLLNICLIISYEDSQGRFSLTKVFFQIQKKLNLILMFYESAITMKVKNIKNLKFS